MFVDKVRRYHGAIQKVTRMLVVKSSLVSCKSANETPFLSITFRIYMMASQTRSP